jgi:spore maturation protein CgeB
MKIAFYGSSLVSSYWNGAATYYRGLLSDLARRGHRIVFYEPDAFDRQKHRDIDPPDWAESRVYPATEEAVRKVIAEAASAEVVVKASGVGVFDDVLLAGLIAASRPEAMRVFWDVDAPATLAELRRSPDHPLHRVMASLDIVLTYGGGPPVVAGYEGFGAACRSTMGSIRRPISRCRRRSASRLTLPSSATACRTVSGASKHSSSTRRRG